MYKLFKFEQCSHTTNDIYGQKKSENCRNIQVQKQKQTKYTHIKIVATALQQQQ